MRTNRPHWIDQIFLFCENIHFWYKMSVEIQPEISGSVGLLYKAMAVPPQHPWVQAQGLEGTLAHLSRSATLAFCYTDPEAAITAQDRTPQLHLAAPKLQPWYICQEIWLLAKIQWLILLNLADVGRKDLTLNRAALYSFMRPQHKALYKTLPFRENITGTQKKYGKKMVTSLSSPEPHIFNTASNSDFRTIVPAGE